MAIPVCARVTGDQKTNKQTEVRIGKECTRYQGTGKMRGVPKSGNAPDVPSIDAQIAQVWCADVRARYPAVKGNSVLTHVTAWMDLETLR